jgi:hypothetical protein
MVRNLRTAVLVVHGMGSQRPLETVRGVINAVWFDDDDHDKGSKKLWSHPEPSGVDLDLTVMTTNDIPKEGGTSDKDRRVADFHELYWAHLMSETKAVAVLLWLFELGRRGPYFKSKSMNALWWCGSVFLCLLLLSTTLVAVRMMTWFAQVVSEPQGILVAFFIMVLIALGAGAFEARRAHWPRLGPTLARGLAWWIAIWAGVVITIWLLGYLGNLLHVNPIHSFAPVTFYQSTVLATNIVLVPSIACLAAYLLMGRWGLRAFKWAYGLSTTFFIIYLLAVMGAVSLGHKIDAVGLILREGRVHWSLASPWSVVAACLLIGTYLSLNAAFLQPYLGDAARYFRNSPANVAVRRKIRKDAVDTLDQLHRSRDYDRIIVVAHSLGTVVAYDMLRAYYSRICNQICVGETELKPEFKAVDDSADCTSMRRLGRALVKKMAETSRILDDNVRQDPYRPAASTEVDAWLVTDFVTLGSPLTHARYLMVNENDGTKIEEDFWCRVRERELLLCPPHRQNGDGIISYLNHGKPALHHGGLFAITRWTNLYFPAVDIFWGDAIGGPVASVFGGCVADMPVWTDSDRSTDGFKHVAYWKTDCPQGRQAPHIKALRNAVDLAETGDVNGMGHI